MSLLSLASLTSDTRLLLAGHAVSALGSGLTLALTAIVLYGAEHAGPTGVTWYFLVLGIAGAAGPWPALRATDRLPPARVIALALTAQAAGVAWLPFAHGLGETLVSAALCGAGAGAAYSALAPLLVSAQRGRRLEAAFAARSTVLHLGLAAGVVLSAAALTGPAAMTRTVFLLDAVSYLAFAALLWSRAARFPAPPTRPGGRTADRRALLRNRAFVGLLTAHVAFVLFGMALLDTAIPLLLVTRLGQPPWAMGLLLALVMAGTVAGALPTARLLLRVDPALRLPLTGAAGTAGYALLAVAALIPGTARTALLVAAAALFAATACAFAGCFQPLVYAAVGPERHSAASALVSSSYNIALLAGPPLGVFMAGALPPAVCALLWACGMAALGAAPALTSPTLPAPEPAPPAADTTERERR
ncbi:MFS transporter [Streptomyces jumonjinensis]|uniref:MFS transporter n=1 Tax=Streptomyces jumonjinensis TaxID=1945 RepID=A0A646KTW6_STRJU|nr:MFS transporter [Streptomyces jumonjinensis]MQT05548.1 MFS transporter [Streptomyces jumonjinensis]